MSVFNRKKKDEPQNFTAAPKPRLRLVEVLRERRQAKIDLANQCDHEIAQLDTEITWLERHLGAEEVLHEFVEKYQG